MSAGGSVALNAFCERKNSIEKVINIGGRLKTGTVPFPKSKTENDNNFLFKESVTRAEKNIALLTETDKKKILTIRPTWDEFAPTSFVTIAGATNRKTVALGHIFGMFLALTAYKKVVLGFLKS